MSFNIDDLHPCPGCTHESINNHLCQGLPIVDGNPDGVTDFDVLNAVQKDSIPTYIDPVKMLLSAHEYLFYSRYYKNQGIDFNALDEINFALENVLYTQRSEYILNAIIKYTDAHKKGKL